MKLPVAIETELKGQIISEADARDIHWPPPAPTSGRAVELLQLQISDSGRRAWGFRDEYGSWDFVQRGDGFEDVWLNGELLSRLPIDDGLVC